MINLTGTAPYLPGNRTARLWFSAVLCIAAWVASFAVGATSRAQATECSVINERTGAEHVELQAAVDDAAPHDELILEGTCVGSTSIPLPLRLRGHATLEQPFPTLDGGGTETVLLVARGTRVVLIDLVVNHGYGVLGGGIRLGRYGELTLRGSSGVMNSRASSGAGIYGWDATVRIHDSAFVSGNEAMFSGGGVSAGVVLMHDDAAVLNNVANRGGGIHSSGRVVLDGSAEVSNNIAPLRPDDDAGGSGAGISAKRVSLREGASVWGNTVESYGSGGGIFAVIVARMSGSASVHSNTADYGGGIVATGKGVTLRGAASISGNTATSTGGGIWTSASFFGPPPVWLYGTAAIVGNMAGETGGGIAGDGPIYLCSDEVSISPNDPDDPPPTMPCP